MTICGKTRSRLFWLQLFFVILYLDAICAVGKPNKGIYQVVNPLTKVPCIIFHSDIKLYLTYITTNGEKDVTVHVPVTSTVDENVSSCDTVITTSNFSIKSQLLRINLDNMDGWSVDFAFTRDDRFKTEKGREYALYFVNITANFESQPKLFPNAKEKSHNYYIHVDPDNIPPITGSIFAQAGHSYFCPSSQKYAITKDLKDGPFAFISLELTRLQAYKVNKGPMGEKETCPTDQNVTDYIPIIVGSCLAALIIITLIVYLIYRSCLPQDVINLVNPDSHFAYDNKLQIDDELGNAK